MVTLREKYPLERRKPLKKTIEQMWILILTIIFVEMWIFIPLFFFKRNFSKFKNFFKF